MNSSSPLHGFISASVAKILYSISLVEKVYTHLCNSPRAPNHNSQLTTQLSILVKVVVSEVANHCNNQVLGTASESAQGH